MPKIIGLILGVTLLALSPGCSDIPALNNLASLRDHPVSDDNVPIFDGVGPAAQTEVVPSVKLPPKDPHAFSIGLVLPTDENHRAVAKSLRQGLELAVAEVLAAALVALASLNLNDPDKAQKALLRALAKLQEVDLELTAYHMRNSKKENEHHGRSASDTAA